MDMIQLGDRLSLGLRAALAGVSLHTFSFLSRFLGNNTCIPLVIQRIHVGIYVAVATLTGMGGVALFRTGGISYLRSIHMDMIQLGKGLFPGLFAAFAGIELRTGCILCGFLGYNTRIPLVFQRIDVGIYVAVTALTGMGGVALFCASRCSFNSFIAMDTICRNLLTFRCCTNFADTLLLSCQTRRISRYNPASIGMRMVAAQIILAQSFCNCLSHHGMTVDTRMNAVSPKLCHIIIVGTVIVHTADQVQINHGHIIKYCHLDNRVAQVPQSVAVNIYLGLIPVTSRRYRIVPGSDNRCYEIELGMAQAVSFPKLYNPLAPHFCRTINGGAIRGVDVT